MAGWKSVDEIAAYRFAVQLRDDIFRLTESGRVARDFDFRRQLRDSSGSAARNLAEGFERYFHGEFAYFTSIAKGSLGETINHLHDGRARGYLEPDDHQRLHDLAVRTRKAVSGLLKHLLSTEAPGESTVRRRSSRKRR